MAVKSRALDAAYFQTYGPGGDKSYAESWQDFTFDPDDVITLFQTLFNRKPKTLLDIGAADGALVQAFLRERVDAIGIENSAYIHRQIRDRRLRRRVLFGDADAFLKHFPDARFDIVIDCATQYLTRRQLRPHLEQSRRVCAHLFCLLVDFKQGRNRPHRGAALFETPSWWKIRLAAAGFKHVPGGEGFFYLK